MPIAAVNPNIEYARPLDISSEPVNNYLQQREMDRRDALAKARLGLQAQTEQDRMAAARQKDIETRMKNVANLGKYDIGGYWHNEQMQKIQDYQDTLTKMIKDGDPNWQEYSIKAAGELEGNRQKALTYDNIMKDKMAQYSKDKSINPAKFQNYWISHTAYNDKGLIPIEDINLNDIQKFAPETRPDFAPVVDTAELSHRVASEFKNNTLTNATRDANGNSKTTTTTAPAYMRINGVTGQMSLNTNDVGKNPVLSDHIFDRFRSKAGNVDLIKEGIYQQHLGDQGVRAAIARAINGHNKGLTPADADYIEPGSQEGSLIGRAVVTNLLAGQQHGNFSLRRSYAKNKDTGTGSGMKNALTNAGLLEKLKGAIDQDPQYLQNNKISSTPLATELGVKPDGIIDLTPLFKNLNVGEDAKGKSLSAAHIFVRKDDPGFVYVDYGNGDRSRLSANDIPTWLNSVTKYNKSLDPLKLNNLYGKIFGTPTGKTPELPASETPQIKSEAAEPSKSVAKTVKDTVKNVVSKWASFKRKK